MSACDPSRLGNGKLMQELQRLVESDRATTAELLAHVGEVEHRRLYVPAGHSSMHEYCVSALGFSDDVAYKRIHVARAAREFPVVLRAIASGKLNLTGVLLLAPKLTQENARELIAAAAGKRKVEIAELLAARFPQPDVAEVLREVPVRAPVSATPALRSAEQASVAAKPTLDPDPIRSKRSPHRVTRLAPKRYALQVTLAGDAHEALQRVRELLGRRVPSGDLAAVLAFCFKAGLEKLEKRKFAATDRPRKEMRAPRSPRTVPAHVKRAVWKRDGGRCTFTAASGTRCNARKFLEFDHIEPVGRGGKSSVTNIRLRCRAHNQYEAECVYGAGFMQVKRERARAAP